MEDYFEYQDRYQNGFKMEYNPIGISKSRQFKITLNIYLRNRCRIFGPPFIYKNLYSFCRKVIKTAYYTNERQ